MADRDIKFLLHYYYYSILPLSLVQGRQLPKSPLLLLVPMHLLVLLLVLGSKLSSSSSSSSSSRKKYGVVDLVSVPVFVLILLLKRFGKRIL